MKDADLEALMREYDAEVAAYRQLPQAEPTALLDRAILTKARAAVAHLPPKRTRPPRWLAVAASFGGVALAATIGWRVYLASQRDAAPPTAPSREEVFEVDIMPQATSRADATLDMAQLPAAPTVAPPPPTATDAVSAKSKREQAKPEPESPVAAASAPAPSSARIDPHLPDHAGAGAIPEQRRNIAPAVAAPAQAPMSDAAAEALSAERELAKDQERPARTKSVPAVPTARAWLADIRQLVRDRRFGEARAELYRFRQHYPDVIIPADLRRYAP